MEVRIVETDTTAEMALVGGLNGCPKPEIK